MDEIINGVWISNISDARTADKSRFNRVITVCQESIEDNVGCQYNFFNMSDGEDEYGGECTYELFSEACNCLVDALENNETVLVHCHRGRSRSVSVVVASIAVYRDISYAESFWIVEQNRPQANPKVQLRNLIREFIENSEKGNLM